SKASKEPWRSMKVDAIERSYKKAKSEPSPLQEYIGAAALAYILDEPNAKTHAHQMRDAIRDQYPQLKVQDGADWGGVVPPMGALFVAALALDIVYDALTDAEIAVCEEVISSQISKVSIKGSWADARRGAHGTW